MSQKLWPSKSDRNSELHWILHLLFVSVRPLYDEYIWLYDHKSVQCSICMSDDTGDGKNRQPVKNVNTPLEQQLAFDFTLTEKGQRAIGSKHSVWMNWSLWLSPRISRPLAPHKKAHFSALQQIRPAFIQTVRPSDSEPSNSARKLGFSVFLRKKSTEKLRRRSLLQCTDITLIQAY